MFGIALYAQKTRQEPHAPVRELLDPAELHVLHLFVRPAYLLGGIRSE